MSMLAVRKKILNGSNSLSPATKAVGYNIDLLTQILLYLPIRSLIRFKSVSKHWLALISDPNFSHRHISTNGHQIAPSGLFLHISSTKEDYGFLSLSNSPFSSPPLVTNPLGLKISQSCNGLLCCYTLSPDYVFKYYIYNPTLNQSTSLPASELPSTLPAGGLGLDFNISLAFDPAKSLHYKVVCIWGWNVMGSKFHQIEIYSSDKGLWRVSGEPFQANNYDQFQDCAIYASSAIHWISSDSYFNIEEEKIGRMPRSPRNADMGSNSVRRVYESRDYLHLVEYNHAGVFVVYELARDYSEWFVKYKIDTSNFIYRHLNWGRLSYPHVDLVYFSRGEKEKDAFLVLHTHDAFVQFNVRSMKFKELYSVYDPRFEKQGRSIKAYPFLESLCCV